MIAAYNDHMERWPRAERRGRLLDDWVDEDAKMIAWSRDLKLDLVRRKACAFSEDRIRRALYRPFSAKFIYYDPIMNEEPRAFGTILPTSDFEADNRTIAVTCPGSEKPFFSLACNRIFDNHLTGAGAGAQGFPFYTYDSDGSNRRENLTDWALETFRSHYGDSMISKWDIFHYVYAVLYHSVYEKRYAANLRRELPRIPFAPQFRPFAEAGVRLAELHVDYEQQPEFPLLWRWKEGAKLDFRVERMKYDLGTGEIVYNEALTLQGIPRDVERYRLGQRSALGWVVDQYRVTTDKGSGIVNDPNREDDPKYILRLIGQVVTVSLETVRIVEALPDLGLPEAS